MATIVNTTPAAPVQSDTGNGTGLIIGLVLLALVFILLYVYGLPLLRSGGGGGTAQSGTQVNIPDKVDVNVHPNQ